MTEVHEGLKIGEWTVGRRLGGTDESDVFEAGEDRVIRMRTAAGPDADLWLAQWRRTMELSHPHLVRMLGAGRAEVEGAPVIFAVMERADETLADALAVRTLSEKETSEVLEPTLSALRYLHENGLVHGGVVPANVMACGETVKLSSDTVRAEGEDGLTRRDDMRALGVLVARALAREAPSAELAERMPEPFRGIVLGALEPPPRPSHIAVAKPARSKAWIYGAIVAIAAMVLVFLLARGRTPPSQPAPVVVQTPAPAAAVTPPPVVETRPSPMPPPREARPAAAGGWFVVVASYGKRDAAEKRAHELTRRWPKFHTTVFYPGAGDSHYLVVIGERLTQEAAASLRERAVAAGLPGDTYIKKFGR